jgi:hypothetical protein
MNSDQEVRLSQESGRGAKARALLEDSMLQEAFAIVEQDTISKWKSAPIRDAEGQLALRLKFQCLQEIRKHLADVLMTGKMADEGIRIERSLKERSRAAIVGAVKGFSGR